MQLGRRKQFVAPAKRRRSSTKWARCRVTQCSRSLRAILPPAVATPPVSVQAARTAHRCPKATNAPNPLGCACRQGNCPQRGITLLELVVAVAIIAVLAAIAVPLYRGYVETTQTAAAVIDIRSIAAVVEDFKADYGRFPETLAEVGMDNMRDPWGNPYQYLNIETANNQGALRKDKFLVPLNTDFDLYSMGKDGESRPPLTAEPSHDDIVRANDGGYVGIATGY